jgi:hypothetical protein
MLKAFATSAVAVAALFGGTLLFVACSKDDGSEFEGPQSPEASDGPISSLVPDGGGPDSGEGGPPGSCTPAIPASFTPTWKAPTRAVAACSAADLKKYYDSCLANPAKTEMDGTCAKFKTDFPTCAACAEPVDNSGPIQWQLSRKFFTVNVAGCIEVTQTGDGGATTGCGEAYNAAVQCTRESCVSCITVAQSFPLFTECQKEVGMKGICNSYEMAKTTPCTGYKNAGSPALTCFNNGGAESSEVVFTRIVAVTCGP